MALEWIGMVFLAVAMVFLWSRPERLLGLQIVATVFGGSAAISLPALGGTTVAPALLCLAILSVCILKFGHLNNLFESMAPGKAGFWLLLLTLWGILSASVLPRLFSGDVSVVSMNRAAFGAGDGVPIDLLSPGSGNITQPLYVVGELAVFSVALIFLQLEDGLRLAARAVIWVAGLNVLAACIDLFGFYSGLGNLLEPLQTASFAFMPEAAFAGIKRINGTFPEASAFAGFTLPVLAFCYVLYREGLWRRTTGPLALASLVVLLLSTSSAGYGGIALYAACAVAVSLASGLRQGGKTHVGHYMALGAWGALAITILLLALPSLREQAWTIIESTLLYKGESSSAMERGEWNLVSWNAFLDTWGLGVGLGSARASSLPMVLVSNLGLPGTLLFLAFIWQVLLGRLPAGIDPQHRAITKAARHGVGAALIVAVLVASVFDLGVLFYVFCAIACTPAMLYRPVREPAANTRLAGVAA
ncbi:hypothetical protein ACFONG_03740 [Uliginosibacterium paludis]|uniref:O-antigen ligase domain-containing protein n=1 Tax=Uliginosibacterium paludis TaxID=1615952 RepID=A0ABV2CNN6_9RHOO